ncbi:hypothetical protein CERSUDRAFT_158863 [Gelatoporia subvermispora B]|uniref:DUF6593 domain-containing protein n=1 Tax=Ceriporiopsis subvermispora (strain B) TaxID=914234 RepID=M2PEU9_CERS8|nr:hypothetical protein CERSUDRAFT_158863 [Gelatoporia subvermispora B]
MAQGSTGYSLAPPLAVPLEDPTLSLYLVPNDPERTTLVSEAGEGIYQITTSRPQAFGPAVTMIKRRAHSLGDSIVAEIEWRRWGAHPVVRASIFDGVHQKLKVHDLLHNKSGRFSHTRYFLGNDDIMYRWKLVQGVGYVLTNRSSGKEVARFTQNVVTKGYFRGQRKWLLHTEPGTLNVDIIVLTFIIVEKKRRDRVADYTAIVRGEDDDPDDGCGAEVGGEM